MKTTATTAILACLLTAPVADAASVHAPAAVQSPVFAVLVDLDGAENATLDLDVQGIGNATVEGASGRGGIEVRDVPDGIHAWRLRITYLDGTTEDHAGAVSVLDMAALVRQAVEGAASASRDAATQAEAAANHALAATTAAEAARIAAQGVEVPADLARTGDLAGLVTSADFAAYQDAEAERRSEDRAAQAEAQDDVERVVAGLDKSIGALLLVVVLGAVLVVWYMAQVRRSAASDLDRALLRAVAVRLEITQDAPEYVQALHDLDVEHRRSASLLDRLRALFPGSPPPPVADVAGGEA